MASPHVLLGVLALTAGSAALVVSRVVFPDMSDNNDETTYRLQADVLRSGHLFPPAPDPAEAARPWLSVIDGDHYVPKYTPVFGAVIAAAHLLTGTDRGALFFVAALTVLTGYWLASEILGSRWQALLAAGLLAASPAILIQSGTYLSYLFVLALMQGFAAALIRGVRGADTGGGSPWPARLCLSLAGFLGGVALFARPYDALLFAIPFVAWWAYSRRRSWKRAGSDLGWLAAGAALPLVAMFAYFQKATGSPLRPPFVLLDSDDRFGFGFRQMYNEDPGAYFTPWRGVLGSSEHLAMVGFWCFGGFVLVGLAAWGIRRLSGPGLALAGVAVTVPVGYVFFWGIWGSTEWGGPRRLGPFYLLMVLTPLCFIGARGLVRFFRWDRRLAALAVVAMTLASVVVFQMAHDQNRRFTTGRDRLYASLRDLPPGQSVIFLPRLQGPWLGQPFALARNRSLDGPVVWALDWGPVANRLLLRSYPGRSAYRLVHTGWKPGVDPNNRYTTRLVPVPRTFRGV